MNIIELLSEKTILIPEIQRDYAQGRESQKATDVREKLLNDFFVVLKKETDQEDNCLRLNYIYGVPEDNRLILIDGQQRVTTLYLLFIYLLANNKISDVWNNLVGKLNYATRTTSEEFCIFLKDYYSSLNSNDIKPSEKLRQNVNYKKKWNMDPTVSGMLIMLDSIDKKYIEISNEIIVDSIKNIKFEFISLEGYSETESLYSAMNSRGKQLTMFEKCKVDLIENRADFAGTINGKWIPRFWKIAENWCDENNNQELFAEEYHDSYLYNYYMFITTVLWYSGDNEIKLRKKANENDEDITIPLSLITKECGSELSNIFDKNSESAITRLTKMVYHTDTSANDNVDFIKFAFSDDTLNKLTSSELKDSIIFAPNPSNNIDIEDIEIDSKTIVYSGKNESDIFRDCCEQKDFNEAKFCMLYAYIIYLRNNGNGTNKELKNYLVLMRSLISEFGYSGGTQQVKYTLSRWQSIRIIRLFKRIVSLENNDEFFQNVAGNLNEEQKNAINKHQVLFNNPNESLYNFLNLPYTCGKMVFWNDNCISEQCNENINRFVENCKNLYSKSPKDRFHAISNANLTNAINIDNYRYYVLAGNIIFTSVISNYYWKNNNNRNSVIQYLLNNDLTFENYNYDFNDWRFYFAKYESFQSGTYGCFHSNDNNVDNGLQIGKVTYIMNEKAYANVSWDPFLHEAWKWANDNNIINCEYSIFANRFQNFTCSNVTCCGNNIELNDSDIIEQIKNYIVDNQNCFID